MHTGGRVGVPEQCRRGSPHTSGAAKRQRQEAGLAFDCSSDREPVYKTVNAELRRTDRRPVDMMGLGCSSALRAYEGVATPGEMPNESYRGTPLSACSGVCRTWRAPHRHTCRPSDSCMVCYRT